jgi:hypothetical protein
MSAQGSAERSIEERSRLGRGFSAAGGAGAGADLAGGAEGADVCWARDEGVSVKHARAAIAIRKSGKEECFETMLPGVSLMLGSPCGWGWDGFDAVNSMNRDNQKKLRSCDAAQSSIIALILTFEGAGR